MNKIYKVIWSKARNCYVVVSELAKRNAKGSGVRSSRMRVAGALSALLVSAYLVGGYGVQAAWAEEDKQATHYYSVKSSEQGSGSNYDNDGATGTNAIAIGPKAKGTSNQSIAIGFGANAGDLSNFGKSIAIGSGASASGSDAIALGNGAIASMSSSSSSSSLFPLNGGTIAIGLKANAAKDWGIAIGSNAVASEEYAVAIGNYAEAAEKYGTSIGNNATVNSIYGTALGSGAEVKSQAEGGVAIGYASVANRAAGTAGYNPSTGKASTIDSVVWKSTDGAVSVGDPNGDNSNSNKITRQITGVAAGSEDTDAVNVAQLKAALEAGGGGGATYTAGNGISIDKENKNAINVNNGDGLKIDSNNKLAVNTGDGLEFDSGALKVKSGEIASDAEGFAKAAAVFAEVRPSDGKYVKKAFSTATNLAILDTQLGQTTNALKTEIKDREAAISNEAAARINADKELSDRMGALGADGNYIKTANNVTQNLSALDTELKTTATALDGKAAVDGSNVKTPATWGSKLGTGVVTDGNGELVTGGTVYTSIEDTQKAITVATDAKLAGKADKSTTLQGYGIKDAYTKTEADGMFATQASVNNKADKSTTLAGYGIENAYTKTETASEINKAITGKADKSTTLAGYGITDAYTRTETDSAITTAVAGKANRATTLAGYGITDAYTQTQTNDAIKAAAGTKADKATTLAGYGITDAYTKNEADNKFLTQASIENKADKSTTLQGYGIKDAYTKTEADGMFATQASVNNKADKSTTLAGYGITNAYTKTETTSEINKAITGKADKASTLAGYGITNAYTKTEADAANSALSDRIGTIAEDGIIIEADKNIAYNLSKVDTALKGATTKVQELFETKANADASNVGLTAENRAAWGAKLGGGTVKSGDSSLVTGGVVYSEVRPADGQFVKQANTTAQNLTALDTTLGEVKKSSDNIEKTLQILEMGTDINFELIGDLADEINQRTQEIETIKKMDGVVSPAGTSKADEFVKGSTVYNEVRPADGNYVRQANTTAENLTELDTQVKANADAISLKANAADVYTKTESDGRFAQKADSLSGYGIKDAYTKTEVDNAIGGKADKSTTLQGYGITDAYTKAETDTALAGKADAATTLAGYGITNAYTKDEVDASVDGKADKATTLEGYGIADAYTKNEADSKFLTQASIDNKADKSTTLQGYGITDAYTKNEADNKFLTQASIVNKADKASSLSGYGIKDAYTITETTNAINTAVAGKADRSTTLEGYGITDAYTKTATDNAIGKAVLNKADKASSLSGYGIKDAYTITETTNAINTAVAGKADRATTLAGYDITDAYTKTETDSAITTAVADKANKATTLKGYGITDAYTQTQTNEAIKAAAATKADKATTLEGYGITDAYTRTEADNTFLTKASIDNKADKSTTLAGYGITDAYTKTETEAKLSGKADVATTLAGYGITDAYTRAETDTALAGKANKSTTLAGYGITNAYTKTETTSEINKAITGKADKASTLAGYGITNAYTKTEADAANSALSDRIGTIAEDGIIIEADKNIAYNLAKVDTALKGATTKVQELFETKANADASNVGLTAENRAAWGAKLGGGTVKSGDSSLVTGGVMYDELRPANGFYVSATNTTGENLKELDKQVNDAKSRAVYAQNGVELLNNVVAQITGQQVADINNITETMTEISLKIDAINGMEGVVAPKTEEPSKADEFVKGSTVYNEVRPADGNYVRQANTTAENLTELDTQVKANADAISLKANAADVYTKTEANGKFANKATTLQGYGITDAYTKTEVDNAMGGKADKATTLAGYGITDAYTKTEVDNVMGGKADKATTLQGYGITDAYTRTEVDAKFLTQASIENKANKADTLAGYGITDAYTKEETTSAIDSAIATKAEKATTLEGYGITDAYTKNEAETLLADRIGTISKDGLIIKADKNVSENLALIDNAIQNQTGIAKDILDKKANADASNVGSNAKAVDGSSTDNSAAWGRALGTGGVESGNDKLVTGDTVYNEVNVGFDGEYVRTDNTAGENLTALDDQVATNTDAIGTNKKNIADNAANIKINAGKIEDNAVQIAVAQKGVEDAIFAINLLATITGAVEDYDYNTFENIKEDLGEAQVSIKSLEYDTQHISVNEDGSTTTINGATKINGALEADAVTVGKLKVGTVDVTDGLTGNHNIGSGNKGYVTGDGLFNELRPSDGNYVLEDNTTAQNLTALDTQLKTAVADIGKVIDGDNGSLNLGRSSTKIAIGKDSVAGTDSVVIGEGSKTTGSEQSIALGYKNTVTGDQSVALGDSNTVNGTQSIAIGHGHTVTGNHSGAFGDPATITGDHAFSVGNNNDISGNNSVAVGNDNKISGENTFVIGNNVNASDNNTVVLGGSSTGTTMNVTGKNSVVLGADSDGTEDNVVSVGSDGKERRVTHVEKAQVDTDAATWGQVKDEVKNVAQGAYNNAVYLSNSINKVDNRLNKVGAGAAALAALHPIEMDNKFGMGIGYGNYRDAHSMALGVFYRPKDNLMFSIGGSMGNGENMVNAGISIALDKGFTNSKAMMARTIKAQGEALDEQRKANAEQEAKIHNLEAENAAIKEQNARLEARLAAIEAKLAK